MRWFNTAGPCQADIHYMLSPLDRLPEIERIIEQRGYFVMHAPRQVGKTTLMLSLAKELTESGRYVAVMLSVEVGAVFPHDPGKAEIAILSEWQDAARKRLPEELHPPTWPEAGDGRRIGAALSAWAKASSRPLVVFIDEIDALQDETLISVLRQLRSGYPDRPEGFPQSLALVGLRDVRDYKVASGSSTTASPQIERLNTSSPFNIKVKSLALRNFNAAEVKALYAQHARETGRVFAAAVVDRAFELTQGQPWLVNALAKEVVEELLPTPEDSIEVEHIDTAKEILIQRQDTHLDSLAERLREPRVRSIIEPMLAGQTLGDVPPDDIRYLLDLGLCSLDRGGGLQIANPIYREVLPKMLSFAAIASLGHVRPTWLTPSGELDAEKLLDSFLSFWRQHGEPLLRSAPYHEIAPHIVLMAFLHRVVNGGGTLEREYAIGTDRMDLCLRYGKVVLGMELKVWRQGRSDPLPVGLAQLDKYLAGLGLRSGWLVIFDRRDNIGAIAERTTLETAMTPEGREIAVIRG